VSDQHKAGSKRDDLATLKRVLAAVVSVVVFLGAGLYVVWPRSVVVVAPQCTGGSDCAVTVSATPEAAVILALLVISAAFALMAVTGEVFSFSFGGNSVTTRPSEVKQVSGAPKDATPVEPEARTAPGGVPAEQSATSQHDDAARRALGLWNVLPAHLQAAAAEYAEDNWDMDLTQVQLATREVKKRRTGKGNHPYWATFETPDGNVTLKLYRGGRGGGTYASAE
jgi:hypothetical protein